MSNAIIYNQEGKILRTVSAPPDMLIIQKQAGEFILLGEANDLTDFINQGEVVARQAQLTVLNKLTLSADGVDSITITNAPIEAIFTATNTITHETISGQISSTDTFSTTIQGTYAIKIESWPYFDFKEIIEAV